MLKIYTASDIGKVRSHNEDNLYVGPRNTFVVADGMGGHAAGEIASSILVDTMKKQLPRHEVIMDRLGLKYVVKEANSAILKDIEEHPERVGMGTTVVLLHLGEKNAVWAHVGDSRLYRLRQGEFKQLSHDHSLVAEMVESGTITAEEARKHPKRNMLLRAVGVEESVRVDASDAPIEKGDIYLLCTDGLTNMVEDHVIAKVLVDSSVADKAAELVRLANENGGRDNITVIVVEYHE